MFRRVCNRNGGSSHPRPVNPAVTRSRFDSAPNASFTVLETVLRTGPHSALRRTCRRRTTTSTLRALRCRPKSSARTTPLPVGRRRSRYRAAATGLQEVKAVKPRSRTQLLERALAAYGRAAQALTARRVGCQVGLVIVWAAASAAPPCTGVGGYRSRRVQAPHERRGQRHGRRRFGPRSRGGDPQHDLARATPRQSTTSPRVLKFTVSCLRRHRCGREWGDEPI